MKNFKLRMKKYDMQNYWNERAKFSHNIYNAVCAYGAPHQFNDLMDKIQKWCLSNLLETVTIKDKKF